jgi:cysteinyl-tRNA synthetase
MGRRIETFEPLEPGKVRMYVCGPTVYDLLHVGNFRGAIFFNLVRNWLEHHGYAVTFVYNYTDIDDKIINRAREQQVDPLALSRKYIAEFENDFGRLKLAPHDHNPKCTEHIDGMIAMIGELVAKGSAYVVDGEVFYQIDKFPGYGKLSGKHPGELQAGHRVEADPRKRDPLDFVLWKPSKPGEPAWDSPWGPGRPGWHIECSCMNRGFFGDQLDIHGGGIDLVFPHHENEIAQSEAVTGKPFCRYWMHNNFVRFGDSKMSKSLGNVVRARDFMDRYHPEILKFMFLSVHYRSPLNLEDEQVRQAIGRLARIYQALRLAEQTAVGGDGGARCPVDFQKQLDCAAQKLRAGLDEDFNTPRAFAAIFEAVREFNQFFGPGKKITPETRAAAAAFQDWILEYGRLFALFQEPPAGLLRQLDMILLQDKPFGIKEIDDLVEQRSLARARKDFAASDLIRDRLAEMGVILHDLSGGTNWELKKG